jgi:DNA-binding transcriptional MerR regulator/methylmalonyl-CoA mutase cobalamin-binding subunit
MSSPKSETLLTGISAVERDTGLSKDTLRMWQRRYGFPQPTRDFRGERLYPPAQVEKLRLIKRLMDRGHRPGKIISRSMEELATLGAEPVTGQMPRQDIDPLLRLLKSHQISELRRHLAQTLARQGLQSFVMDTVAPLNEAVGEAWMRGDLAVFEEHLHTELMQSLLRNAISGAQSQGGSPRVLLTSLPNELHGLGLLMVEAVLAVDGAFPISLGTETPAQEIVAAARAHGADVVALSFSAAYPQARATEGLRELRSMLPDDTILCAGGAGAARIRRPIDGVQLVTGLGQVLDVVKHWRARQTTR